MAARFLVSNLIQATGTVLGSSSIQASLPTAFLRDQLRSKVARTQIGWDVVTGAFDRVDVTVGGTDYHATIAAGTYATGAAYAAAVQSALTAAIANAWSVTYSPSTFLFTVSGTSAFILKFGTGTNVVHSAGPDLGFAAADTASGTSVSGATAVYQSRKWFTADLGSSQAVTAAMVINHNAGSGGTFSVRGSNTSVLDALTNASPLLAQSLTGDATIRGAFFASASPRYLALLVDDRANTAGYSEVGIWYAGPYSEPGVNYSIGVTTEYDDLSSVQVAISGPQFAAKRQDRPTSELSWTEVVDADMSILIDTVRALTPKGADFFLAWNPSTITDTKYGWRHANMKRTLEGPGPTGSYWTVALPFAEALG